MSLPPADSIGRVRLDECPQCEYSLQGLASFGRCPECGFEYDDDTFTLRGISRGVSTTPGPRILLWTIVGIVGAGGSQFLPLLIFARGTTIVAAGAVGAAWLGLIIYLLLTGKRERKGMETFLFAAGGFGPCSSRTDGSIDATLMSWRMVRAARLDRSGATWHRLRIGCTDASGALDDIRFDAGVRCDAVQAQWIAATIQRRIHESQSPG